MNRLSQSRSVNLIRHRGDLMSFHVGQRVVCVRECRDNPSLGGYFARCTFPQKGTVYTIRAVRELKGRAGVWLCEIVNPIGNPSVGINGETGFLAEYFRPLDESRLDIFRAMLVSPPKVPA